MANTKDQMQDVFPIVFNFVNGEMATSEKLTGLVKHTDVAFSRITQGIGDPWDYTLHDDGTGSRLSLSLENLGQSSLARVIGASDFLSPMGGCFNESITTTTTFVLKANRNSWTVGYPLVKLTSPVTENNTISVVTPLTWNTDIGVLSGDTAGVFATRRNIITSVVAHGDFYVDFYKGVIISYTPAQNDVTFYVSNMNMLGASVPWGTHNVIPHWNQSVLCNCTKVSDTATTSTYTITFPEVSGSSRFTGSSISGYGYISQSLSYVADTVWSLTHNGNSSLYRIPAALTQSSLSSGNIIPEGYIHLWEGDEDGRIIPQITFYYRDENSLTVVTPLDWLSEGDNYRIITSGTSTADSIAYLMSTVRNNEHVGLINNPSLSYTIPLSHDNLEDRYSGNISYGILDLSRWKFTESNYVTNCHPQYLHRGGYMEYDADGNHSNAMRGDLLMAASIEADFAVDTSSTTGMSKLYETAALAFGIGNTTKKSTTSGAFIRFEGAADYDTYVSAWVSGTANRIPFSLTGSGCCTYAPLTDDDALGALSLYSMQGAPLYLRGQYNATSTEEQSNGAILGFDLGQRTEANYIKLMQGYRSGVALVQDAINLPAKSSTQTATSVLDITPDLATGTTGLSHARISADQVREFRFRGISWISDATNTSDALGGTNVRASAIPEFQHHFTSPGMVGADFINVYSNAIFFSDTGDGKATSFTTHASEWLNTNTSTKKPSGIYYVPDATDPYFSFQLYDSTTAISTNPLNFGDDYGLYYIGVGDVYLRSTSGVAYIIAQNKAQLVSNTNVTLDSSAVINIDAGTNVNIDSGNYVDIDAHNRFRVDTDTIYLYATKGTGSVNITAGGDFYLEYNGNLISQALKGDSAYITGDYRALYINTTTGQIVRAN